MHARGKVKIPTLLTETPSGSVSGKPSGKQSTSESSPVMHTKSLLLGLGPKSYGLQGPSFSSLVSVLSKVLSLSLRA